MSRYSSLMLLLAVLVSLNSSCPNATGQNASSSGKEGDVSKSLNQRHDFKFRHAHIQDVVRVLRDEFRLNVRLDTRAIGDMGLELDRKKAILAHQRRLNSVANHLSNRLAESGIYLPHDAEILQKVRSLPYPGVSFEENELTLRSALHHLLRNFDLTYVPQGDVLWITSSEAAESKLLTRVYDISDLALVSGNVSQPGSLFDTIPNAADDAYDYDSLMEIITVTVDPESWEDLGGPGSLTSGEGTLTISQSPLCHETIDALLQALRKVREESSDDNFSSIPVPVHASSEVGKRNAAIKLALQKDEELDIDGRTLEEVIKTLRERHNIPILLDRRRLANASVSPTIRVSIQHGSAPLQTAIQMILDAVDASLTHIIDHEAVLITTREFAEEQLRVVVYPVGDLVRTESSTTKDGNGTWDFDSLIGNLTSNVRPESWEELGGMGTVQEYYDGRALVIDQTDEVHQRIEQLLSDFRGLAGRLRKMVPRDVAEQENGEYATVVFRLWQPWHEKARVNEEDLAKLLQEMIEPDSWNQDEVFVRTLPSRLIIRQTRAVHRRIYDALRNLAVLKPLPRQESGGGMMGGMGGGALDEEGAEMSFGGNSADSNRGFGGGGFGGGFGSAGALPSGN